MTTPSKPKLVKASRDELHVGDHVFIDDLEWIVHYLGPHSVIFRGTHSQYIRKDVDDESIDRLGRVLVVATSPLARRLAGKSPQEIDEELKKVRQIIRECLVVADEAYEATGFIKVAKTSEQRMRIEEALADLSIPQESA